MKKRYIKIILTIFTLVSFAIAKDNTANNSAMTVDFSYAFSTPHRLTVSIAKCQR